MASGEKILAAFLFSAEYTEYAFGTYEYIEI